MVSKKPCARGCDSPIDCRDKAAVAFAGQGGRQFEVAPRRCIDLHDRARYDPARRREMRRAIQLRQADIVDKRARRGDFRTAEIAEPVERADTVMALEPAARTLALE